MARPAQAPTEEQVNDAAAFEAGVGIECADDIPYSTLMYFAMRQDVVDNLDREEGDDPFDDETYEEED